MFSRIKQQSRSHSWVAIITLTTFVWTFIIVAPMEAVAGSVPAKTIVQVTPISSVSPENVSVDSPVQMKVVSDVKFNERVVIAANAPASGKVTHDKKKGIFGKPAKIGITIISVQAVDGSNISVNGKKVVEGKNKLVVAIIVSLLTVIGGFFIKGGEATIAAGTPIQCAIDDIAQIEFIGIKNKPLGFSKKDDRKISGEKVFLALWETSNKDQIEFGKDGVLSIETQDGEIINGNWELLSRNQLAIETDQFTKKYRLYFQSKNKFSAIEIKDNRISDDYNDYVVFKKTGETDEAEETSADILNTPILFSIESDPSAGKIYWRVISSTSEVKNTTSQYLGRTPFEESKILEIKGLTVENASKVQVEIKISKTGYYPQKKRMNLRSLIDQKEMFYMFDLEKED